MYVRSKITGELELQERRRRTACERNCAEPSAVKGKFGEKFVTGLIRDKSGIIL